MERLGRYSVLKHLASGGMADVLLARTDGIEGFERHVVVKRIRAEHAKDQRFIDMFLDEARLAANLHHQNIVQVHDIGESGGEFFFAMEYIHGEDVRRMLSAVSKLRQQLPLEHIVAIGSAVAAGLHHAHERRGPDKQPLNIVHRDVSPSNILVGYDGSVKVVDFGIAKAAMRQGETRSGNLKGKVSYMSPEQCKSSDVDRRSDVYSLGVVLYELATTTRLFKSDSDYLVMDAICTGKVPAPKLRRADLPAELSAIIMRALHLDPDKRFQTADELRIALDRFASKAGLVTSAGTLAGFLHKLFGERAEPWLDHGDTPPVTEATAPTVEMARKSWTELPRTEGTATLLDADEAKTTTGARRRTSNSAGPRTAPAGASPEAPGTGTSTRLGWEQTGATPTVSRFQIGRAAIVIVPLVAVIALLAYKLVTRSDTPATAATPGQAPGMVSSTAVAASAGQGGDRPDPAGPAPVTQPAAATPPAAPTGLTSRSIGIEPDPQRVAPGRPAVAAPPATHRSAADPPVVKPAAPVVTERPAREPPVAAPPSHAPAVPPVPAREPTVPPAPPAVAGSNASKPAAPVDAAVGPAPPPVELQVAQIAPSVVNALASRSRRELLACEGSEPLSGDLTVRFEVNAAGRVSNSQLQSTLGKAAVAACILRVVRTWRFPRPPSGAARGAYSISYQ